MPSTPSLVPGQAHLPIGPQDAAAIKATLEAFAVSRDEEVGEKHMPKGLSTGERGGLRNRWAKENSGASPETPPRERLLPS